MSDPAAPFGPTLPGPILSELAFVRACAAPRAAPARPEGLDGDQIAAIAHRHQVVPLVVAALRRAGAPLPPALAARHHPLAALRSAREAVRLCALLEEAGIAPVFLKGSALAVLAYGAVDRRQFSDIDLLVAPRDAGRAAALLEGAGYRATDGAPGALATRVARRLPLAKDIVLRHPGSGQTVELHWRMADNPRERPVGQGEVQRVAIAPGTAIPTLVTEPLFAYLCAHGAAHCWARLRWLADVAALIARAPDGGDALWRAAVARGQRRAAASAILLSEQLLGLPPPPSFVRPASLRLLLLLAMARRVIEAGGGATELSRTRWRGWAEMAGKLLVVGSPGDAAGWAMRMLFSAEDDEAADGARLRYLLHPLRRVPRLLRRRRMRRQAEKSGSVG